MEVALAHVGALRPFLDLTRPRVVALVVFTALPVLLWGPLPPLPVAAAALVGTCLVAAACSALNAWVERESDGRMARTRNRPLPSGRLAPGAALAWGIGVAALGHAVLWWASPGAAVLGLLTTFVYVGLYTTWLKRRSAHNTVVGAVAGAAAPLIADAAVHGWPGFVGWVLFAVVFLWQMPHFWAIALYRAGEYAAAGIPMMPAVVGPHATRVRMLVYALALLPVSLLPVATGHLGWLYALNAAPLGTWLVLAVVRALRRPSAAADRRVFTVSVLQLMALFGAMVVDLGWRL